jgi:hypothetical protein
MNFSDGTSESADVLVYATGYQFSFPFHDQLQGKLGEDYPIDFYKTVFWLKNPRISFVGCLVAPEFVKAELEVEFIRHVYKNVELTPELIAQWQTEYDADVNPPPPEPAQEGADTNS